MTYIEGARYSIFSRKINYQPGQRFNLLRTIPFKFEGLPGEVALFSHNQFMKREKNVSPIPYVILR